jgi:cobalt-zinc-cadmium efflux system membrane fusion protein
MAPPRVLSVAGCVLVLLAGCSRRDPPAPSAAPPARDVTRNANVFTIPPDSPQLKQMRIEPVRAADVPADEVVTPGKVLINPNRTSKLLLPVAGRIVSVSARLGDSVTQGQPLVGVESPDADAAVAAYQQAQATERQAQATLTKAQADFDRTSDLYHAKAVAQKDLVATQNDLNQAKAGIDTARASVEQARRKLQLLGLNPHEFHQRTLARAPITGKVLEINVAPGEYRTDTSAPLMTIADLTTVWVSSDVPESAIRLVHVGDRVTVTFVAYPDETFSARVTRIADVLDPQTRTIKVYLEMPNPAGRLRPEMFGSVRHAGSVRTMPVLPLSALVQEYGKSVVFVERGPGEYERREITIGTRSGDVIPVASGVRVGERVIVDGAVLLKGR